MELEAVPGKSGFYYLPEAKPLKVAVIGTGRIGAFLEQDRLRKKPCTHLGTWTKLHAETYIAEPNDNRREAAHVFFQPAGVYADYSKMLDEHQFDIVSVATPPETHKEIVNEVAKKKAAKLVFCEKPIAPNTADARSMIAACANHGVKLAINHTRRWESVWQYVAWKFVRDRYYGDPVGSVGYFSGDLVNDGTHIADLVNWYGLKGPKSQVYNLKDIGYLIFELDIFFRAGRVRVTNNGRTLETLQANPSKNYEYFDELEARPNNMLVHGTEPTPMYLACEQLIEVVQHGGEPKCTGTDGLHALERALKWREISMQETAHG